MRHKLVFVTSLVIILLFSWANADLFGNSHIKVFSEPLKQALHFFFLGVTGMVGYFNWKNQPAWMQWLWGGIYIVVFAVVAVSIAAIFVIHGNRLEDQLKVVVVTLRNGFTGPLPFLTFYVFIALSRNIQIQGQQEKNQQSNQKKL